MAGVLKYHNGSAWVPVSYPTATDSQAGVVKLANNCTTTSEGFALDARQGKALQDQINNLSPVSLITTGLSYINSSYVAGGYCIIGKLVLINMQVKLSSAASSAGLNLINGFPKPYQDRIVAASTDATAATSIYVYPKDADCFIRIHGNAASGTTIAINCLYLTK